MTIWLMPGGAPLAREQVYELGWHPMYWMWGWSVWGFGMTFGMLLFWFLMVMGLVLGIRWLLSRKREE